MPRTNSKSETLTIRLDPIARFKLDFVARLLGQTITAVVERAISDCADEAGVERTGGEVSENWRDFWSPVEAEREIRIAREPKLYPSYEQIRRLRFAERFADYFFLGCDLSNLNVQNAEVLWPVIDAIIDIHESSKASDVDAVKREMDRLLKEAGVVCQKPRTRR